MSVKQQTTGTPCYSTNYNDENYDLRKATRTKL